MRNALQVMYNRAAQFWHALYNIFSQYKLIKGRKWMHFFGTQQRFFRQMLMAAKVSDIELCTLALQMANGRERDVLGTWIAGKACTKLHTGATQ